MFEEIAEEHGPEALATFGGPDNKLPERLELPPWLEGLAAHRSEAKALDISILDLLDEKGIVDRSLRVMIRQACIAIERGVNRHDREVLAKKASANDFKPPPPKR